MKISKEIILNSSNFFHPRATIFENKILMTMQTIGGSDYFGPLLYSVSENKGESWTTPEPVPGLGRVLMSNGIEEGVCDVVSNYHPASGTVIAIGHNVYYKNNCLYDSIGDFHPEDGPKLKRFPVYTVLDDYGKWIDKREKLHFPEFERYSIYSCNCSQSVVLPDGKMLIPITFGNNCRRVTSFLCDFYSKKLSVIKRGNILKNPVGRGLLEPSIVEYQNTFYMTMRAEDECGYLSVSNNGLDWQAIKSWQWNDGAALLMSTTQQHWLKLGGKLYLVYTRKTKENREVMRWRAPLFIAEVDTQKLCLLKDTEQIVLPICGDLAKPETIGLMGNFHPLAISDTEAIVTVGEMRPKMGFSGATLLARITV